MQIGQRFRKSRLLALVVMAIALLLFPGATPAAAIVPCLVGGADCRAERGEPVPVRLVVNGTVMTGAGAYEDATGYVMVPVRATMEALGATVTWNEPDQSELIELGESRVMLHMGSTLALVNGRETYLPLAPRLIQDRVFGPVRSIAEALGATVTWDEVTRTEYLRYSTDRAARDKVNLVVNGAPLDTALPSFEENGVVMAPMRAVLEAAGADVTWREQDRSESATLGGHKVTVWMDSYRAEVNGKAFTLPRPPREIQEVVFVPIRAVAEALGAAVIWDEGRRTEYVDARGVIILMCDKCVSLWGRVDAGHIAMVTLRGERADYYSWSPENGDVSFTSTPAAVTQMTIWDAHKLTTHEIVARVNATRYAGGAYNWGFEMTGVTPADAVPVIRIAEELARQARSGEQDYHWKDFNCLRFVQESVWPTGIGHDVEQEFVPNLWAMYIWRDMGYSPFDM